MSDFWGVLVGLFLLGYGVFGVLRPNVILKWVAAAHRVRDLDVDASAQRFTRVTGALVGGIGLYVMVVTIIRALQAS